jgi:NodT family efflux transporter outer membrane factor (OMF) lipoprotein
MAPVPPSAAIFPPFRLRLNRRGMTLAVVCAALAGCAVGPDYQPPPVATPGQWSEPASDAPGPAKPAAELERWWRGFKDRRLDQLVARAIQGNADLKIAAARVAAARAERLSANAAIWPRLDSSAGYERLRISPNAAQGLLGSLLGHAVDEGTPTSALLSRFGPLGAPFNLFQAGFDASWELDLFGGLQRRREAAEAGYAATVEAERDTLVTLTAEVARTYLELIHLERRQRIAAARLENQREILRLAENAYQEGLETALAPQQARAELEAAAALPPAIEARIRQTRHALAVLLGQPPAALDRRLADLGAELPEPPAIPLGLPADILRRRPDLRRAEREAAEATATVGVAVAELFPKLSLTGSVGFQSQELSDFTHLSSGFYGFGPRLSLPVFEAGRLSANVDLQESKLAEALQAYGKAVLAALKEVEDALAALNGEQRRRAALATASATARDAVATAKSLYAEGEADFLAVLVAQRTGYEAEESQAQSDLAWSNAHIALFKALGGGWPMDAANPGR